MANKQAIRTAFAALALAAGLAAPAAARVVAADTAYADVAAQVAGPASPVLAILRNPATDPHLFEATASAARAIAGASIVIGNGAGYDPWIDRLLAASPEPGHQTISIADLLHRHAGDNPHLWYDPAAMPALATTLADALIRENPGEAAPIAARRDAVLASLASLRARIADMREKFAGAPVAATEPVFGPMLDALGLIDRHARFERAVMNGTEPRASDIARLEDDIHAHRIRVLITNAQATNTEAERLIALARAEQIPCVPVTETLPAGTRYQDWVGAELTALSAALATPRVLARE